MRKFCESACERCPLNTLKDDDRKEAVVVLSDMLRDFPFDAVLKSHELGLLREDVVEIVPYENGVWPNPDIVTAAAVRIAMNQCVSHPLSIPTKE